MNDTTWIVILVALTMVGGRLAKLYPKLPKGLMPVLSLALGAGAYVAKATQVDGIPVAEALMSWQVIITGASAIVGHDLLKPALVWLTNERIAVLVMGRLAKPEPKEKPSEPGMSAGGAISTLWIWTAVCWFGISIAAVVTPGCGASAQQVQARVADTMAKSVNEAKEQLLVIYEKEGDAAIPAPDRETSDAQLAAVCDRWAPVWAAIKAFAVVHDQWATAIEQGGAVDLEGVLAGFCKFVGLAKPWLELPDIPGAVCPEVSP